VPELLLIVPRFRGSCLGGMVNRLPPPNLVSLLPDTILRKEGDIDEAKLFPYLSIVHLQSETRKRPLAGFRGGGEAFLARGPAPEVRRLGGASLDVDGSARGVIVPGFTGEG